MSARVAVAVAGLLALALPGGPAGPVGLVLAAAGLLALVTSVLYPGTTAPAVLITVAALSWLAGDHTGAAVRLPALALAVAVVHSAAALAAVVPAQARVPRPLLLRWAGWTVAATVAGLLVVGGTALFPPAAAVPTTGAALAVLGAAVLGGSVLLGRLLRRSRAAGDRPGVSR
jgi:hypothetical protein